MTATLESRVQRYTADILQINSRLNFRGLTDAIDGDPHYFSGDLGDGLITLSVRDSQLPVRYLRGIHGFRLAQYLRAGLMSQETAYQSALFHEPIMPVQGLEDIHTIVLCDGKITGYIGLVRSGDPASKTLDDPSRRRFPSEVVHDVDLLRSHAAPGLGTHQVCELKRFARDGAMPAGPLRNRVPLHLMLGMGRAGLALQPSMQIVLGDSTQSGTVRHLQIVGFDPVIVETSARPNLPKTDLMWPSYLRRQVVKPFAALRPDDFTDYLDILHDFLADPGASGQQLVRALLARRREVPAHG